MTRIMNAARCAALAATVLAAAACGDDEPEIVAPDLAGSELFRSYVSLGNSLTAGWQSGGITDSTQRESYAYLLAVAAGLTPGEEWIYPSLAAPGCPPPVANFRTLSRGTLPGATTPATSTTCLLRDVARVSSRVHNVAVPLAYAWDLTRSSTPTSAANPLQTIILGGRTQLRRALEAEPTFASLWIGNNEALGPASTGTLAAVAGASAGFIPVDTVRRYIGAAVDTLVAAPTLRGGLLVGVVDVRNAPRLFPADSLFRGTTPSPFKFSIDSTTGRTVTVLPNCINSGVLVSSEIIPLIRAGTYPPIISCAPVTLPGVPATADLGNLFVLNATEQTALAGAVAGYNAYIRAKADSVGWAYYDPNNAVDGLPALRASGLIARLPRFTNETAPFGAGMSVDGVHPRRAIHVALANAVIAVIKAKYPEAAGIGAAQ
jgi:lysophospholipase L1-like esterase